MVTHIRNVTFGLDGCCLCLTITSKSRIHFACRLIQGAFCHLDGILMLQLGKTTMRLCKASLQASLPSCLALRVLFCTAVLVYTFLCANWTMKGNTNLKSWLWRKSLYLNTQHSFASAIKSMLELIGARKYCLRYFIYLIHEGVQLKRYYSFCQIQSRSRAAKREEHKAEDDISVVVWDTEFL